MVLQIPGEGEKCQTLENILSSLQAQQTELEKQGIDTSEIQSQILTTQGTLNELRKQKNSIEGEIQKGEAQLKEWEGEIEKSWRK